MLDKIELVEHKYNQENKLLFEHLKNISEFFQDILVQNLFKIIFLFIH